MGQINLPDICITELANQNEVFNSCGLLVKSGIQKKIDVVSCKRKPFKI